MFATQMLMLRDIMGAIGSQALKIQRKKDMGVREKTGHQDIVTEADRYVETELCRHIAELFPEDGIRAEEGTLRPSQSGYEWRVDPIDGTTVFSKGLPFFGISAGKGSVSRGDADFGIVHFPAFAETLLALTGGGAFDGDGNRIAVPSGQTLRTSLIAFGPTPEYEHFFSPLRRKARNALAFGSCVYETSLVVKGHLGAYVHTGPTVFDIAAVIVIAREAGCVVGRADGAPIDLREDKISGPVIFAANKEIFSGIAETFRM